MQPRIIFMGTPDFAVPALETLSGRFDASALLVVTQPDRAAGRGRRKQPPPVKIAASRHELAALQVETLRAPDARMRIEAFSPDLVVVAAFGLLLPRWLLRLPPRGCVNLHASLLPRFRGASPVAAAIASGDAQTGVCLMEMEAGLDTGGVYAMEAIEIQPDDTTESLTERLASVAGELLLANLDALLAGELAPLPQRGKVVETRKIVKDHGAIDWSESADVIERHVRAMWSWPRAWTVGGNDTRIQVHRAAVIGTAEPAEPGTVLGEVDGIVVAAGAGGVRLETVQLPGKQARPADDLAQHPVFAPGTRLGLPPGFTRPDPWIVEGPDV